MRTWILAASLLLVGGALAGCVNTEKDLESANDTNDTNDSVGDVGNGSTNATNETNGSATNATGDAPTAAPYAAPGG